MSDKDLEFFGKVDRDRDGNIGSTLPAWYFDAQVDTMKEGIQRREAALERGDIPSDYVYQTREDLKRDRERLDGIESSRPRLNEVQTSTLGKTYKELSSDIRDSMFTRDDVQRGFADAHEEARRMVKPCIKVDPELARKCGVTNIVNGMVSRNDATKILKITGKALGEETNVERLRKMK